MPSRNGYSVALSAKAAFAWGGWPLIHHSASTCCGNSRQSAHDAVNIRAARPGADKRHRDDLARRRGGGRRRGHLGCRPVPVRHPEHRHIPRHPRYPRRPRCPDRFAAAEEPDWLDPSGYWWCLCSQQRCRGQRGLRPGDRGVLIMVGHLARLVPELVLAQLFPGRPGAAVPAPARRKASGEALALAGLVCAGVHPGADGSDGIGPDPYPADVGRSDCQPGRTAATGVLSGRCFGGCGDDPDTASYCPHHRRADTAAGSIPWRGASADEVDRFRVRCRHRCGGGRVCEQQRG